jgi:hypothetical protein
MTDRRRIRKPLEDEELLRGSYSAADLDRIIAMLGHPEFHAGEFIRRLDLHVLLCVEHLQTEPHDPPSVAERKLRRFARQIENVLQHTDKMSPDEQWYVERAASVLAEEGDAPPGVEAEVVEEWAAEGRPAGDARLWPVDDALADARRRVAWLHRCASRGAQLAKTDKREAGGGVPLEAEHDLFRGLVELFHEFSAKPARADSPRTESRRLDTPEAGDDDGDVHAFDEAIERGETGGNLINFLEACLRPLDYAPLGEARGRVALYYTLERLDLLPRKDRKETGRS